MPDWITNVTSLWAITAGSSVHPQKSAGSSVMSLPQSGVQITVIVGKIILYSWWNLFEIALLKMFCEIFPSADDQHYADAVVRMGWVGKRYWELVEKKPLKWKRRAREKMEEGRYVWETSGKTVSHLPPTHTKTRTHIKVHSDSLNLSFSASRHNSCSLLYSQLTH